MPAITPRNRGRKSSVSAMTAPIGGMNDRDSIAAMPPGDAILLENWFPGTQSVDIRGGSVLQSSELAAACQTIMGYNGVASSGLFAAAGDTLYDIEVNPATDIAGITLTSDKLDWLNFGGAAGNYLVAVNGADLPVFYDGTTWVQSGTGYATAITGVDAADFSQVSAWKNRLFFVEKNTMKVWYLGSQAIGGAATSFNFAGVAKRGGKLVATASVPSSSGDTPDDYFVAITSEGECLIYRGTDIAAADFGLVGSFRIGRPIANGADKSGGRFLCKVGSDLIAVTESGAVSIQAAINIDVVANQKTINDKIVNSVIRATNDYADNFGWQIVLAPSLNKLIINVPQIEGGAAYQFVMNTITGGWCKFTGWDATCFCYWQDSLYMAIGTDIYQCDVSQSNDFVSADSTGSDIQAKAKTAFQYFGGMDALKSFKMIRPLLYTSGDMKPLIGINVDYNDAAIVGEVIISSAEVARWGVALWGVGLWGTDGQAYQNWISVNGIGYSAALKIEVSASNQFCKWHGWEIMFERGGLL